MEKSLNHLRPEERATVMPSKKNGALPFCLERWSCRGRIQEGVSRQIGQFPRGQKDDVGQASE